ncbi:hypothetical protein Pmar_PMAR009918, partial [Perkinsus marinus ATCC 50983]
MNTSARNTQEDFTNQGAVVDDGASPSTSSSLEAPEPHYVVPKVKAPSVCPIFGRLTFLTVVLVCCLIVAAVWFCHGYSWVYDKTTKIWPIYECPSLQSSFHFKEKDLWGPTCSMSIKYDFLLADRMKRNGITVPYGTPPEEALERCILPHDDEGYITCFSVNSCDYMCREADTNGRCPAGKTLNKDKTDMDNNVQCNVWLAAQTFTDQLACYKLEVAAYCGRTFKVTPSNILAVRGLIVATVVMLVFWIIAEFVLRSVDKGLR